MFISPSNEHKLYDVTDWVINLAQKLVTRVRREGEGGSDRFNGERVRVKSIIRLENHCDTPFDPMFRL